MGGGTLLDNFLQGIGGYGFPKNHSEKSPNVTLHNLISQFFIHDDFLPQKLVGQTLCAYKRRKVNELSL